MMDRWLKLRIKVTSAALWVALRVFNGLNEYSARLCEEARQVTGVGMAARKKKDDVDKILVCCVICSHVWKSPEDKYLPDVDCPQCGASSPMVVENK